MLINNDEKKYSLIILINSVLAILYVIFNINALGIHVVPISLIIFEFFTIIMILLIKIKPLMKDDSK